MQAMGLAAWWPVGEGAGTTALDYAGRGYHLAFQASPEWRPAGGGGSVLGGQSVQLVRASSQYLSIASTPVTAYPVTMACWFSSTDITVDQQLLGIYDIDTANNHWSLQAAGATAGDPVRFAVQAGGAANFATSAAYVANTWTHACGVGVSSTLRACYVNGGTKGTTTTDRTPTGLDNISLGRRLTSSPGNNVDGKMTDARIYSRALSDAEVYALYDPGTRWELYYPLGRRVFFDKANAAGGTAVPVFYHHLQQQGIA